MESRDSYNYKKNAQEKKYYMFIKLYLKDLPQYKLYKHNVLKRSSQMLKRQKLRKM